MGDLRVQERGIWRSSSLLTRLIEHARDEPDEKRGITVSEQAVPRIGGKRRLAPGELGVRLMYGQSGGILWKKMKD